MTALMGDGVTPGNVPRGLFAVAGYVDGPFAWPASAWLRFPGSRLVRIATMAGTDDGDVLDVENGDATPQQAPAWVAMRRRAGRTPAVYCNQSTWPAVLDAFAAAGVDDPLSWRADWNVPTPHLLAGTVATQYAHDLAPGYDLSQVDPAWLDSFAVQGAMMTYILRDPADGAEYVMPEGAHLDGPSAGAIAAGGAPLVATLTTEEVQALLACTNAAVLAAIAKVVVPASGGFTVESTVTPVPPATAA